jgi:hypothetical protein
MGTGRKDLGEDGGLETGLGQLDGGPQAGAASADDDRIKGTDSDIRAHVFFKASR